METKVLTAHVPLPLAEKVDEMAARLERPRGWIVKQALSAWIEREEARLHDFLAPVNPHAAATLIRSLVAAPARLLEYPRIGQQLDVFRPRDVRRFLVGRYEIRYEIQGSAIVALRLWHTREDR